ncbi:hypothetical protein [Micromonospora sp. NPDC049662]|uniref:hypothetical protein n=1 Tax=Micromonospora sp. NPDC049662 TaxID=3155397 RepID=UPI0034206AE2
MSILRRRATVFVATTTAIGAQAAAGVTSQVGSPKVAIGIASAGWLIAAVVGTAARQPIDPPPAARQPALSSRRPQHALPAATRTGAARRAVRPTPIPGRTHRQAIRAAAPLAQLPGPAPQGHSTARPSVTP